MLRLGLFGGAAIAIGLLAFYAGRRVATPALGYTGGFRGARPVANLEGPSSYYLEIDS